MFVTVDLLFVLVVSSMISMFSSFSAGLFWLGYWMRAEMQRRAEL
jgi:hypothetical protein